MEIRVREWDELNLRQIADLTYSAKRDGMRKQGDEAIDAIVNWLRTEFRALPRYAVLARSEGQLIGWLMLVVQNAAKAEINPWFLGGHPLVALGHDWKAVGFQLIEEAVSWAKKRGFECIELTIASEADEIGGTNQEYDSWYRSLGFQVREESVGLFCDLSDPQIRAMIADASLPAGFDLKPISDVNEEALYHCYYDTFSTGQSQFFFDQSETERREYFKTFGKTYGMNAEASVALVKDRQVVGFSYVLPVSGGHCFIDWMGVHPDFRRRGLGTFLLHLIMTTALHQGARTMGLNCDAGNTRAIVLYKANGWQEREREIKFSLKLEQV